MDPLHKQINTAIKERGRPAHTSPLEGDALPCSRPAHCALRAIFDALPPQRPVSRLSAPKLQARRAVLSAATTIESRQYAGLTPESKLPAPSSPPPIFQILSPKRRAAAFTLVESVVAIGLFAFVIVGIVGLFGTALERQRQASFETRAVMVSQQILARIRSASSATNVAFTSGSASGTEAKLFQVASLRTNPIVTNVFYYKKDGTEISGMLQPNSYETTNLAYISAPDEQPRDIVGRARVTSTTNGTGSSNLFRVTIEVSEPANLPLMAGTNFARKYRYSFSTLATLPN